MLETISKVTPQPGTPPLLRGDILFSRLWAKPWRGTEASDAAGGESAMASAALGPLTCLPATLTQMRFLSTSCMWAGCDSPTSALTVRYTRWSAAVTRLSWGHSWTVESQEASAFT